MIFIDNQHGKIFQEYTKCFDFNAIPYQRFDVWNNDSECYDITRLSQGPDSHLIILHDSTFFNMLSKDSEKQQLLDWVNQKNILWVAVGDLLNYSFPHNQNQLLEIDKLISHTSVYCFVAGLLTPSHRLNDLVNINIIQTPVARVGCYEPQIRGGVFEKGQCQYSYLLLMIKNSQRPARKMLYNRLQRRDLLNHGIVNYHKSSIKFNDQNKPVLDYSSWVGNNSSSLTRANHPSINPPMDLVLNSWLEIVPETFYKGSFSVSEKTMRVITTRTPFLVVTTCRYLDFLKNLGFKTFHGIIDESYDRRPRIQDRIDGMLDQLEDIIRNGEREFYDACKPILEHNYQTFCAYVGDNQRKKDQEILLHLRNAGLVDQ